MLSNLSAGNSVNVGLHGLHLRAIAKRICITLWSALKLGFAVERRHVWERCLAEISPLTFNDGPAALFTGLDACSVGAGGTAQQHRVIIRWGWCQRLM